MLFYLVGGGPFWYLSEEGVWRGSMQVEGCVLECCVNGKCLCRFQHVFSSIPKGRLQVVAYP